MDMSRVRLIEGDEGKSSGCMVCDKVREGRWCVIR